MACLDDNLLAEYRHGRLPSAAAALMKQHVDGCQTCRGHLDALPNGAATAPPPSNGQAAHGPTHPSQASRPLAPIQPGQLIAEKYRVDRVLGTGGMGVVVAATHLDLQQPVALKFMQPTALGDAEAVGRFLREARAVVRLKTEHVGRVLDLGKLENGAPFIVMEYLEGEDLDRILSAKGPFPISVAVDYLLQALEAVAEAHAAGIVHRDLKPANLFLTRTAGGAPQIKVLDFGISKYTEANDPALSLSSTHNSVMMGSPLYMAPEQLMSASKVDSRADIWSLGASLYQMVSGKTPFDGETIAVLAAHVLQDAPLSLKDQRPDLPPNFEAVVMRCLQRDVDQRFRHVGQLADALAAFASPEGRAMCKRIKAVLGKGPADLASTTDRRRAAVALTRLDRPRRGSRRVAAWLGAGTAVAVLLTAALWVFWYAGVFSSKPRFESLPRPAEPARLATQARMPSAPPHDTLASVPSEMPAPETVAPSPPRPFHPAAASLPAVKVAAKVHPKKPVAKAAASDAPSLPEPEPDPYETRK
jgi:serine/threonine-protein kinase